MRRMLVAALCLYVFIGVVPSEAAQTPNSKSLQIYFIDVEGRAGDFGSEPIRRVAAHRHRLAGI